MGNSNLGFGLTSFNHTGTATSSFPPNPVSGQMAPCGEGDRHVLMQEPRLQHHLLYETMEPVTHVGEEGEEGGDEAAAAARLPHLCSLPAPAILLLPPSSRRPAALGSFGSLAAAATSLTGHGEEGEGLPKSGEEGVPRKRHIDDTQDEDQVNPPPAFDSRAEDGVKCVMSVAGKRSAGHAMCALTTQRARSWHDSLGSAFRALPAAAAHIDQKHLFLSRGHRHRRKSPARPPGSSQPPSFTARMPKGRMAS
uniref:Uncharacterized protein n=1 Tax=Oryza sativa subsp. japonica TaxID=39947 RepID=Q6ZDH2_ORYSJ|nr:hypothetical protein [Oryza sativa Japonica Group]